MNIQEFYQKVKNRRQKIERKETKYMFEHDTRSERKLELLRAKKEAYDEIMTMINSYYIRPEKTEAETGIRNTY